MRTKCKRMSRNSDGFVLGNQMINRFPGLMPMASVDCPVRDKMLVEGFVCHENSKGLKYFKKIERLKFLTAISNLKG